MTKAQIEIAIHGSIDEIGSKVWDTCANVGTGARSIDPFTTYRFLSALEQSGSVGPGTGWSPRPISATLDGQIIAVAPLYVKGHSQGEYVFDYAWANAFENAGGEYYPKLQIAVPFTPATGRRLLTRSSFELIGQSALIQGAIQLASTNNLSSLHLTFCTEPEAANGTEMGLLHRTGQQFHWVNAGYQSFADFTGSLSSRKRKQIHKERKIANDFGGEIEILTGSDIEPHHWDAFWNFYQSTGARKWGTPYLTREFFDLVQQKMRDDVLLVMAKNGENYIAGALNFIGSDALFGRYWGCVEHHSALHFELCYYRAIDFAIEQGLSRVEAGAQGGHKLARGYLPVTTHSLHWIADPDFRRAVTQFLDSERPAVAHENEVIASYGPFRKS